MFRLFLFCIIVTSCWSFLFTPISIDKANYAAHFNHTIQNILRYSKLLAHRYNNTRLLKLMGGLIPMDPEVNMNASQLITSKGYPCEDYTVRTEDGFYLEMQRIPHGIDNKNSSKVRPVVFLQHGLLGCSTNFLSNLANESLAYILADAGYDVWLGNSRGTTYGLHHDVYPTSSKIFWQWSFDQMAAFDLPASLDLVTKVTGHETMYYVAHSQGSLVGFLGFSENQTLAKKIKLMVAMGPVYTVGHISSIIKYATLVDDKMLYEMFGHKCFLPQNLIITTIAKTLCRSRTLNFICRDAIATIANFDKQYMNTSRIPVYLTHTPAGTSTQNMDHFAQLVRTKTCQKYNYGSTSENILHYGQATPPKYDVTKLKVPVALFSGGRDTLADPKDVAILRKLLKTTVSDVVIPEWAHLEFIWATNGWDVMFKQLLDLLQKY
ncbi:gastric triacylglycerol lipase-like [Argonauta hians]